MNSAILKIRADIAGLSVFSALKKHPLVNCPDNVTEDLSREVTPLDLIRDWRRVSLGKREQFGLLTITHFLYKIR
jgi:hypothetical protein